MKAKGLLFFFLGLLCVGLLVMRNPGWQFTTLLALCVWSFCRFCYFAFYVPRRYVDPKFKFSDPDPCLCIWRGGVKTRVAETEANPAQSKRKN